jgi:hypothetical protein
MNNKRKDNLPKIHLLPHSVQQQQATAFITSTSQAELLMYNTDTVPGKTVDVVIDIQ